MTDNYELPTLYSSFIHLSRYSRWLDDKGRRETWQETVDRYLAFFKWHLKTNFNYNIPKDIYNEVRQAILTLNVMPSMRALMTAGEALKRDNIANYNCLGGDTLVTTKEYGIIPIKELVNKSVHIVDGNGNWILSKCYNYGKQNLYKVEINTSGKGSFSINSTYNHDWILKDGSKKKTNELSFGDRLSSVSMPNRKMVDEKSDNYKLGVIHGIFYGDGTANYKFSSGKGTKNIVTQRVCAGFIIRLCGKSNELLRYFNGYPVSQPKSYNGDNVVYISNSAIDLKSLPELDKNIFSDDYLTGFMRGWIAADGYVGKSMQVSLASIQEGVDWLNIVGPKLGFNTTNIQKYPNETNFGTRKENLYGIILDRRWLIKDDFILSYKKDRFESINIDKNPGFGKIKSVSEKISTEEVYCFEVPTTQSFLLHRNLLTGNCSFIHADRIRALDEMLYVLLNGVGVGFSVERQFVQKLPVLSESYYKTETTIVVADSKLGWAKAYKELLSLLTVGEIPKWDLSKIRPAGSRLRTFGGRSSGPVPLDELFLFTVQVFTEAAGRKLTSFEMHKLFCKIADVVVVGGVRRASLISLSNLSDIRMRHAKSGQWSIENPELALANNSTSYTEKPDVGIFMEEWLSLYNSKSGERGIFNREASINNIKMINERAGFERRDINHEFGINPCGEIILRDKSFCNLSEVVVREKDTEKDLKEKIRIATILGTWQATLTDFKYVSSKWKDNCDEERLLGVSMTGIMDNPLTNGSEGITELKESLNYFRQVATDVNKEFAKKIGINQAAAITCVKPSGNISQLCNSSSGIHARYSPYYIRSVRVSKMDPIAQFMIKQGFSYEPEIHKPDHTLIFKFPVKSPAGAITRTDKTAIEQLELWMIYKDHYCVSYDTKILTNKGNIRIGELVGKKVKIWNGKEWSLVKPFSTGRKKLFNIELSNGVVISCTEGHKFILDNGTRKQLKDLKVGCKLKKFKLPIIDSSIVILKNAYSQGFYSGDGFKNSKYGQIFSTKYICIPRLCGVINKKELKDHRSWNHGKMLPKEFVPDGSYSIKSRLNWFAGLIDSDGCKNGKGIAISSVNKLFLSNVQLMLVGLGCHSIVGCYDKGGLTLMPDGKGGKKEYDRKTCYTLFLGSYYLNKLKILGLKTERVKLIGSSVLKYDKLKRVEIVSINEIGINETYCFTEDKLNQGVFNGILTGQCDHNVSQTINVKEHEWMEVGSWVFKHFDKISGVAFLPSSDHSYKQAPYEECTKEEFIELKKNQPKDVDWTGVGDFETTDMTTGSQELACTAGGCEI